MAEAKKIKARVLATGAFGKCDDVVTVTEADLVANKGVLDASPAAVEYAESLSKPEKSAKK
jgi:hypothetical protein